MEKQNSELHVVFGTGPLGMAVARELARRGKTVKMVNRSGKAAEAPVGVQVVAGDAYDPASTRAICKGATVVYQCAQPAYTEWPTKFPTLQAGIVEGAAAAEAKLVVGDNLYMYGEVDGPLTEALPNAAQTRKGRVRGEMAATLLEAHQSGKVRVAIGRGSDFYGPGVFASAVGDRVFYPALAGKKVSVLGKPDLPHTYTYIEDFGSGLVTLGEHDKALGQVWHIPNAPTVTTREFINLIFEEAGHPAKVGAVSKPMLAMVGLFVPTIREMGEMFYEFDKPFVVDHRKFEQAFGNQAIPQRDAIRQTLEWFRFHKS